MLRFVSMTTLPIGRVMVRRADEARPPGDHGAIETKLGGFVPGRESVSVGCAHSVLHERRHARAGGSAGLVCQSPREGVHTMVLHRGVCEATAVAWMSRRPCRHAAVPDTA